MTAEGTLVGNRKTLKRHDKMAIYPKSHYVTPKDRLKRAVDSIRDELIERRAELEASEHGLEAGCCERGRAAIAQVQVVAGEPGGGESLAGLAEHVGRAVEARAGPTDPAQRLEHRARATAEVENRAVLRHPLVQQGEDGVTPLPKEMGLRRADLAGVELVPPARMGA